MTGGSGITRDTSPAHTAEERLGHDTVRHSTSAGAQESIIIMHDRPMPPSLIQGFGPETHTVS